MPELPEVETVRAGLAGQVTGLGIAGAQCYRADIRVPMPLDLPQRVAGARIAAVRRRGKYLLLALDRPDWLVLHLGMSGRLLYHPPGTDAPPQKHDHLRLTLENGAAMIFNDPRRFGLVDLVGAASWQAHPYFAHLGPEPLEEGFNGAYLLARASGSGASARQKSQKKPVKMPVKSWLMDGRVVVGVGNIYASEALFQAGIHPLMPAGLLTPAQCEALAAAVRQVLRAAIASGGSTLRDYVRSSGDVGYFQHQFRVYGRKGEPCSVCAAPIRHGVLAGRATYWCNGCQPAV